MNEMVRIWVEKLFDQQISETKESIGNERLWMHGANSEEEVRSSIDNLANLNEYLIVLKKLKKFAEEEC